MTNRLLVEESQWRRSENVALSADGASLVWSRPFAALRKKALNETELFADFAALAHPDARPEDFLAFGRMYGPLLICEHGLPRTHIRVTDAPRVSEELLMSHGVFWAFSRLAIVETLSEWRILAGQAHAMATIADQLHSGKVTDSELWSPIRPLLPDLGNEDVEGTPYNEATKPIDVQRRLLALAVNVWLSWSDVGLTYSWDTARGKQKSARPRARLGASTLFGSIAFGLTLKVSSQPGSVRCSGCGIDFIPMRRRDPMKNVWCDSEECRRLKGRQEAQRHRDRHKS